MRVKALTLPNWLQGNASTSKLAKDSCSTFMSVYWWVYPQYVATFTISTTCNKRFKIKHQSRQCKTFVEFFSNVSLILQLKDPRAYRHLFILFYKFLRHSNKAVIIPFM